MAAVVDREERRRRLREKSKRAREQADELLAGELKALREATRGDLEALRPRVTDAEVYEELLRIVNESTAKNESIAELQARLKKAGKAVQALAKEAAGLLGPG